MADVNLTGDARSLVNALNQASEAFVEFDQNTARIVSNQARLDTSGTLLRRNLQLLDATGNRLAGTFQRVDNEFKLVGIEVTKVSQTFAKATSGLKTNQQILNSALRETAQVVQLLGSSLNGLAIAQTAVVGPTEAQAVALALGAVASRGAVDAQIALASAQTNTGATAAALTKANNLRTIALTSATAADDAAIQRSAQFAVAQQNETGIVTRLTIALQIQADARVAALRGLSVSSSVKRLQDLQAEAVAIEQAAIAQNTYNAAIARRVAIAKQLRLSARIGELRAETIAVQASTQAQKFLSFELSVLARLSRAGRVAARERVIALGNETASANKTAIALEKLNAFRRSAARVRAGFAGNAGERTGRLLAEEGVVGFTPDQGARAAASIKRVAIAQRELSTEQAKSITLSQRLRSSLASLGKIVGISLLIGGAFRLVTALSEAVDRAIEFSQAIAEVKTIDSARIATTLWETELRKLSDAFGISVIDQAEAAYQALSNQVADGTQTFKFLTAANRLAVAAVTDASNAVNLLTSALNAFSIPVTRAEELSAQFFKTVELGRVRIDEMAQSLGTLAVPAAQLGVTLPELQAAIATTTIQGVKFNQASTLVRNVLLKLIRPTDTMKRFYQELGVASGEAAIATFGLGGFLARLEERTGGASDEIGALFGRIRAITGAMIFAGDGLDRFNKNLAEIRATTIEDFGLIVEQVVQKSGRQLEIEATRIRNFFEVDLGQSIIETLAKVNRSIGGFSRIIRFMASFITNVAVPSLLLLTSRLLLAGNAAVRSAGGMLLFAKSLGPIGIALGALTAIGVFTGLQQSFEKTGDAALSFRDRLVKNLGDVAIAQQELIDQSTKTSLDLLRARARSLRGPLSDIIGPLNKGLNESKKEFEAFTKETEEAIKTSLKGIKKLSSESNTIFKSFKDRAFDPRLVRQFISGIRQSTGDLTEDTKKKVAEIRDLFRGRDLEIFKIEFDAGDTTRRIQLLGQRVEQLEEIRRKAVQTGDLEDLKTIQTELRAIQLQRGDLIRSTDKQLTIEGRRILKIRQIKELIEEEAKLRARIAEDDRIRAFSAQKILFEQQIGQRDLLATFEEFKGKDFKDALKGGDIDEIKNTFRAREQAAQRLIALQKELGTQRVDPGRIQDQINLDRERAVKKVLALETQNRLEAEAANQKRIQDLLKATAQERKIRQEGLATEVKKLDDVRKFLDDQIRGSSAFHRRSGTFLAPPFGTVPEVSTDLEKTFGLQADLFADHLLPKFDELIAFGQLDTKDITANNLSTAVENRKKLIDGLEAILRLTNKEQLVEQQQQQLQAAGTSIETSELREQFKSTNNTIALFEGLLKILNDTSIDVVATQKDLLKSQQDLLEVNRFIEENNKDFAESVGGAASSVDLLQTRIKNLFIAVGEQQRLQSQPLTAIPFAADDAVLTNTVSTAVINSQSSWDEVIAKAVTASRSAQVENAKAVEQEKQQISIREELRQKAAIERERQKQVAATGPGAKERAALLDPTVTGGARRKAIAEARAEDRAKVRAAAIAEQDTRLGEAAKARGVELTAVTEGEIEARKALIEVLKSPENIVDPLQRFITDENNNVVAVTPLTDALSVNSSTLDVLNLLMQDLINNIGKSLGIENTVVAVGREAGGPVFGPAGVDKVPAMLTSGEFVVNKQDTRRFFPQLMAMNSGRVSPRGFQDGGPVGPFNITVTETQNAQVTARQVVSEINRGIRQRTIRLRGN